MCNLPTTYVCTTYVQLMYNLCTTNLQLIYNLRTTYVQYNLCAINTQLMYVKLMYNLCTTYVQLMYNLYTTYVQVMYNYVELIRHLPRRIFKNEDNIVGKGLEATEQTEIWAGSCWKISRVQFPPTSPARRPGKGSFEESYGKCKWRRHNIV